MVCVTFNSRKFDLSLMVTRPNLNFGSDLISEHEKE